MNNNNPSGPLQKKQLWSAVEQQNQWRLINEYSQQLKLRFCCHPKIADLAEPKSTTTKNKNGSGTFGWGQAVRTQKSGSRRLDFCQNRKISPPHDPLLMGVPMSGAHFEPAGGTEKGGRDGTGCVLLMNQEKHRKCSIKENIGCNR